MRLLTELLLFVIVPNVKSFLLLFFITRVYYLLFFVLGWFSILSNFWLSFYSVIAVRICRVALSS